jgi:hypothetical protein
MLCFNPRYPILLALAVVSFALVAAGCGGGDSTATSLTKTEFVKQAEAICLRAEHQQLVRATEYVKQHPGADEEAMVLPAGIPPLEEEIRQIKALGEPEQGADTVQAFVAEFEKAIADAKEDPADVVVAETDPFKKADKLAASYGLEVCSHAP